MTDIDIYSELAGAPHIKPAGPTHANFTGEQGLLCGFNATGEVVTATAAADGTGSQETGPVPARGVLFPDHVTDLDNDSQANAVEAVRLYKGANDTLAGEHRASLVAHGFIVQNQDEDWGFTCGEPVYLDTAGGGFTQTKPATAGEIVQAVGYPVNIDRVAAGEAVWVDIDIDYTTV